MSHAWVYVAALVLTADAVLFRVVVAVRIARARKRDVVVRDDLSVQELALLAGGRRRVVTTVLARMGRQGRLAVTEDGDRVVLSGTAPDGAADAVEEAVVRAAGVARGERAGKLVAEVADGDAVRSVARRLCADGLLLDPGVLRAQYRARRLLVGAAVLSPR
ncbi:hypothetical protein DN402_15150 [Streptomyces sp. SW4]|nr:hypothetical protein DN402_15150 [Streptomyces sp. SW4]